jgi:hypothetical protein
MRTCSTRIRRFRSTAKHSSWFDIAGADGVYSYADARIKDGQVRSRRPPER